ASRRKVDDGGGVAGEVGDDVLGGQPCVSERRRDDRNRRPGVALDRDGVTGTVDLGMSRNLEGVAHDDPHEPVARQGKSGQRGTTQDEKKSSSSATSSMPV